MGAPTAIPVQSITGGFVYFMQAGDGGAIKIGHVDGWGNLERRRKELQTGNDRPLRVLAVVSGGQDYERELHQRFAFCQRADGGKEWFEPDRSLLTFIAAKEWRADRRGEVTASVPTPIELPPLPRGKKLSGFQWRKRKALRRKFEESVDVSGLPMLVPRFEMPPLPTDDSGAKGFALRAALMLLRDVMHDPVMSEREQRRLAKDFIKLIAQLGGTPDDDQPLVGAAADLLKR